MTRQRRSLAPDEKRLLCFHADPQNPPPETLDWPERVFERILDAAQDHGVLAIVWRKLRGPSRAAAASEGFRKRLARIEEEHTLGVGQSMLLRHHGARISKLLREQGIPAEIVKGPVFADQLYEHPADRPFTDIDILADVNDLLRIGDVVEACGFERDAKAWDNSERYQEYKWYLRGNDSIMVEVQGNMVHYPALRRRLSFGYAELKAASPGDEQSAVAMLLIAVVHALGGHKFHRLLFAVDIAQAARRISDPKEMVRAAERLGAALEVRTALSVTSRLFRDAGIEALARHFPEGPRARLGQRLMNEDSVLDAMPKTSRASHLRRHGFRWLQMLGPGTQY
jgi:hypothetical protein